VSSDKELREKLKTYISSEKNQIMKLTNDRLSFCMSHQINPKADLRIMQLGLEIKVLSAVQKVAGITNAEIMEKLK